MSVQEFDSTRMGVSAPPQADQAVVKKAPVILGVILLCTLLIPIQPLFGPIRLTPTRAFLAVIFIPVFIKLVTGKVGGFNKIDGLLLFVTFWAFIAMVVNHDIVYAIEPSGVYLIEFFGAYALGRVAVRSFADFAKITKWLFFLMLLLFPFAIYEALTKTPILLNLIPDSIPPNYSEPRMGLRRVQSVFAHPILYGVFVSTGFGLFWFMASNGFKKIIGAALVCVSTFISLSTGALLAVVIQIILVGWEIVFKFIKARWRIFAVLSIAGYIFVDLAATKSPFHVLVNYATLSSGSAYNRILIWQVGTANVADNPIFGLGFQDWVRPRWMSASVDNYWLLITMRYGLPAIIAYVAAIFLIFRAMAKVELITRQDQMARAGYLVSFGGIILAGGTVHYWHVITAFVMFFIGSGMWMITGGEAKPQSEDAVAPEPVSPLSPYTRQTAAHSRDNQTQTEPSASPEESPKPRTSKLAYSRPKDAPALSRKDLRKRPDER